jgi:hypothetical protein
VGRNAMLVRQKARSDERLTLESVKSAGWSDTEIKAASSLAWEVCRTTNYLDVLKKRGVDILYCQGSNDNVSPGLLKLGENKEFASLPVYIMPGGQHGGAKEAGFTKPAASQLDVDENLYAFAMRHFFGVHKKFPRPSPSVEWDKESHRFKVSVLLTDGTEPQSNEVFWSVNRHPDYSLQMEFDEWKSAPLQMLPASTANHQRICKGEIPFEGDWKTVDFITVHKHTEDGTTFTISSHVKRVQR